MQRYKAAHAECDLTLAGAGGLDAERERESLSKVSCLVRHRDHGGGPSLGPGQQDRSATDLADVDYCYFWLTPTPSEINYGYRGEYQTPHSADTGY